MIVPTAITYNPLLSPTSHVQNTSSEYIYAGYSKIVQGNIYSNDTLTFSTNTSIPNTQLALESSAILRIKSNGTCIPPPPYDKGIIGLSPYINSKATQGPSFRQNLFSSSAISSQTMITYFSTPPFTVTTLSGGLILGAIDTSKFIGPLVRIPNVAEAGEIGYYAAKPNITFNGQSFTPDVNTSCLLDSGTHADYLPFAPQSSAYKQFLNASGGMLKDENSVLAYNGTCESIPQDLNISYVFAGLNDGKSVKIDLPVRNYARGASLDGVAGEGICLLNLEVGGCTFGAPFYSGAVVAVDDENGVLALAQGGVSRGAGVDAASLRIFGKGESFDYV
jgi:hypothetical protein